MHGTESWPVRKKHEVKSDRNEASTGMLRWMYGFKLKERKKTKGSENCWNWIQSV